MVKHLPNHRFPHQYRSPFLKPSEALLLHRETIRLVVARNDACNPRVFGSTIHGSDTELSDLDILVDPVVGRTSLLSLVRIKREIEKVIGITADIQTPGSIHEKFRQTILSEAVPV
jgi:uncharacterized protein